MSGMHWEISFGFAFLLVLSVTLWGAAQGWFSKIVHKKADASTPPPPDPTLPYKNLVKRLEARVFELENELALKNAEIADLKKKLAGLMDAINSLTTNLQNATALNEQLKAALKTAFDDLAKCRAELQKCQAKQLGEEIKKQACRMAPENANLLR
jgi:septal ring factor EnvC (AmiA/AmiB activator)